MCQHVNYSRSAEEVVCCAVDGWPQVADPGIVIPNEHVANSNVSAAVGQSMSGVLNFENC